MTLPEPSARFPRIEDLARYIEDHRRQLLAYVDRSLGPSLRSRLEPEDIFQEVTLSALAAPQQFEVADRDPFRQLCQLAEQRIIDAHRHHVSAQKRSTQREISINSASSGDDGQEFFQMLSASITSPSQAFSRDQKEFRLQIALLELSAEQREVLRLRFVEGLPTKDIAARIDKSDGAIRVMLTRSIAQLQQIITSSG